MLKRIVGALCISAFSVYTVVQVLGSVDLIVNFSTDNQHWIWRLLDFLISWAWLLLLPVGLMLLLDVKWATISNVASRVRGYVGATNMEPPAISQPPLADALHMRDSGGLEMSTVKPEFRFRAEEQLGEIIVFAAQVFDMSSGHDAIVTLTNIQRVTEGLRATTPEFHKGKDFPPLNLRPTGDKSDLHYGLERGWRLVSCPYDRPKIEYWWDPKQTGDMPHPLGEYIATIEIRAGGKLTERTVQYLLDGKKPQVIAVGP